MSIIGRPTRAYAPLRALAPCGSTPLGSILGHLRACGAARLDGFRRAIVARPDRRVAGAPTTTPIVFLSVDGRTRLVVTTVDAWRGEPIGNKYDAFVDMTGQFVGYYEPAIPVNRSTVA